MPKAMFTQGVCVLLDRPVSIDDIESALAGFEICGRQEASESWAFSGPTLIVEYRPDANGLVAVDMVNEPWPDDMGGPEHEIMIFGAWSLGHFGPFAYPGCLLRAGEHSWSWGSGKTIAERHKAFIRIRLSYAFGTEDDAPVMPDDCDPLHELEFVTRITSSLLTLPGALCYFNPNGEVLRDSDGLREQLNFAWEQGLAPLNAWSNVRLFNVNSDWVVMDTVGNQQLDIPDIEAILNSASYDLGNVDAFLRSVSQYILDEGDVIRDGDTMDGPGGIHWQSRKFESGVCEPPRPVLRWFPLDDYPIPPDIAKLRNGI